MSTRAKKVLDPQAVARQADHRPTEQSAMKLRIVHAAVLLIVPAILTAQTPTRDRKSATADRPTQSESTSSRDRVVGPKVSNHSSGQTPQANTKNEAQAPAQNQGQASWGNTAFIIRPSSVERSQSSKTQPMNQTTEVATQPQTAKKLVQPTSLMSSPVKAENANSRTALPARPPVATATYNVGVGDVLDVRLSNTPTRESTLFTVMKNGTLEYPLLNGSVSVAGLSTDEISRLLSSQIKVIKAPRITVSVRDYASHSVVIGGLVDSPGKKILRREAMPLFAVLAEALVRPEAIAATILRNGKECDALSLKDDQAMASLVMPGDIIKISGAPVAAKKFLYVGGEVGAPGEKVFREGMTLTQALLSAGGASTSGKIIRVARRNSSGFLSTNEYNLRSIVDGKTADPMLEAGDRIEVIRGS